MFIGLFCRHSKMIGVPEVILILSCCSF